MSRSIEISSKPSILVFTDLDGSLLDHANYSHEEAIPALKTLNACRIPVIPTTSKTIAEIKALPIDFHNAPMIGENGMVIEINGKQHIPGRSYLEIQSALKQLPDDLRQNVNGFADMSVNDVTEHTGLSLSGAQLAKDRMASEPFLWSGNDTELEALKKNLQLADLHTTRGGRFYHIMSRGSKASALSYVSQALKADITIALGDGPNDAEMLGAADYGVRIPNPHGHDFDIPTPKGKIMTAPDIGPKGWNAAVHNLLDELGVSR